MRICGTIPGQFRNFQTPFMEQRFGGSGRVIGLAVYTKFPSLLQKLIPEFCHAERRTGFYRRKIELHARPEVLEILVAHKMKFWALRAQYPTCFPNCRPSRARRNLLRLLAKYPQIGKRLSLNVLSAYPPL
jgi:hypothetical protein